MMIRVVSYFFNCVEFLCNFIDTPDCQRAWKSCPGTVQCGNVVTTLNVTTALCTFDVYTLHSVRAYAFISIYWPVSLKSHS